VSGKAEQALQARTGVQFQDGALFSSLTVADNIIVPIREHAGLDERLMQRSPRSRSPWSACRPIPATRSPRS
jgi:phospholipid/cholesterol/gamma-HCH transport system ATP-binding protein